MTKIDLLVGVYGFSADFENQVLRFLDSLCRMCNLEDVNVFCVEREHAPISNRLRNGITGPHFGFQVRSCPLLPCDNLREDTSLFCEWMVDNVSTAPWFVMSHFDLDFTGDYFSSMRQLMPTYNMIGTHHDGIMLVNREAYNKCKVGFCGVDGIGIVTLENTPRVVSINLPINQPKQLALSMDVGELLILRMGTLGLKHDWLYHHHGLGKSDLFIHSRNGSGHEVIPSI